MQQRYNQIVHTIAVATAIMTFPLIFMGGLVTSHGAAMSVPDWPNTWGYNMFLFPPSKWVGGILFEHTHRLAATVVGLLTIVLMAAAWLSDRRPWVRWMSVGVFLAVCVQGTIGGLRVVLSARDLAIVHGCAAQAFFCLIATYCVMTSRFWTNRQPLPDSERTAMRHVSILAVVTASIIFAQLIVGAIMRHSDAGLAIPDFPTSYGHWLPPTSITTEFRRDAIHQYGLTLGLNRVTLFQIWIHFAHRIGALLVTISAVWLSSTILHNLRQIPAFFLPALILLFLIATQLTLGILTVMLRKPADIASAHVALGALVLVTACVIAVRAIGLTHIPRPADFSRPVPAPPLLYTSTDQ